MLEIILSITCNLLPRQAFIKCYQHHVSKRLLNVIFIIKGRNKKLISINPIIHPVKVLHSMYMTGL